MTLPKALLKFPFEINAYRDRDNLRASITNGKQIPYSASHWLNVIYKTKHQKESIESLTISPTGYDKS